MKYMLPLMHIPKFFHHYRHVHKAHVVKEHNEVGGAAQLKNGCGFKEGKLRPVLKFKL